jgi:PPK2 family polyphosphate:nucleotide phosphotransferase
MKQKTVIDGSEHVRLSEIDPAYCGELTRESAAVRTAELLSEISELQELMYAAAQTAVLIVLQGMDTAGKDGSIQHVVGVLNAQNCRVASFKVPTLKEAAHDFLWRVHQETPARGEFTIFNRSHYEDVLVVRVHKIIDLHTCKERYEAINAFERLLSQSNTVILKFFLHISNDEQERRLLDREKDPAKAWKLSPADWKERALWQEYQDAYEDALNHCGTACAPWHIVPANHKWYRNLVLAETIAGALRPFRKAWADALQAKGAAELAELKKLRG